MNRSAAREIMMQLFFQMDAQNEFDIEIKESFLKEKEGCSLQKHYIEEVFNAYVENREKIDAILEEASANWKISRMGKVDLAISRLATTELLFLEDIPTSVAINEAVNLAKKFGAEDSGKFINGILGKVAKQLPEA